MQPNGLNIGKSSLFHVFRIPGRVQPREPQRTTQWCQQALRFFPSLCIFMAVPSNLTAVVVRHTSSPKDSSKRTSSLFTSSQRSDVSLCGPLFKRELGVSLVVQWLRTCLPMQGTWVRALVREDPTCCGAAGPLCHSCWAWALEPMSHNYWVHVLQLLKPACLESVLHNKRSHPMRGLPTATKSSPRSP